MWLALHKPVSLRNNKVLCAINEHHGKWVVLKFQSKRLEIMAIPAPVYLLFAKFPLFLFPCPFYQSTPFNAAPFINAYASSFYCFRCIGLQSMPPYHFQFSPLRTEMSVFYTGWFRGEMSTFWEVIVSVIVKKKKLTRTCVYTSLTKTILHPNWMASEIQLFKYSAR